MAFEIEVLDEPVPSEWHKEGQDEMLALLRFGSLEERTAIPVSFWPLSQYRKRWANALDLVLASDNAKSALISQFYDPGREEFGYGLYTQHVPSLQAVAEPVGRAGFLSAY